MKKHGRMIPVKVSRFDGCIVRIGRVWNRMTSWKRYSILAAVCYVVSGNVANAENAGRPLTYTTSAVGEALYVRYWGRDQLRDTTFNKLPPEAHVATITEPTGSVLTVTSLWAPVECGPRLCPVRILRDDVLLDEFSTCSDTAQHFYRFEKAGTVLTLCGREHALPAQAAQLAAETIPYDSGAELANPKDYVFREYWGDVASTIDWKVPLSKRGMIYNSPLQSADGRQIILTTIQSGAGSACDSRCPVRAFTAKHEKILDIRACRDLTQHRVSGDHRSFIACGEVFPIPQVSERAALLDNAPPGSDPDAYLRVVDRERRKPANVPKPVNTAHLFHNNSEILLNEWNDGTVELAYDIPRAGLPVVQGTLLFRGVRNGTRYSGTAYAFKAGCEPAPYAVTGFIDPNKELIVLTGAAPRREQNSCNVIGNSTQSRNAKLVFEPQSGNDK
jgi:hypothetical protein